MADSELTSIVPWIYNNPRVNRGTMDIQLLPFKMGTLEIHQDTTVEINAQQNTAYKIWDGAYLLGKHLENVQYFKPGCFKGKTCIELGAGCAVVGMAAWLLGAQVTVTDLEECLQHCQKCVNINVKALIEQKYQSSGLVQKDPNLKMVQQDLVTESAAGPSETSHCGKYSGTVIDPNAIKCQPYKWGTEPVELDPPYDYIFASDVVYHPKLVRDLLSSLEKLSHSNTCILLSYKPRGLGEDIFFKLLKTRRYNLETIPAEDHPKEFMSSEYDIYHITKKCI